MQGRDYPVCHQAGRLAAEIKKAFKNGFRITYVCTLHSTEVLSLRSYQSANLKATEFFI